MTTRPTKPRLSVVHPSKLKAGTVIRLRDLPEGSFYTLQTNRCGCVLEQFPDRVLCEFDGKVKGVHPAVCVRVA